MLVQEELQHGDVPAELAARERSRAEERRAERAELAARLQVGDARDVQPVDALERAHRGDGLRPDDRVDRPEIEALRAQRDLEPCVLRIEGMRPPARAADARPAASAPASVSRKRIVHRNTALGPGFLPQPHRRIAC